MVGPELRFSEETHKRKYRLQGEDFRAAGSRFAQALTDNEGDFHRLRELYLSQFFLPAGRLQASVGSPQRTTAFNCFVSGTIEDSIDGIMDKAKEAANTMRLGGGIGYGFSTLRPRDAIITTLGSKASGAVSFMGIYDAVCGTVSSAGDRRGAQMGVLRVDHPDIEEFIEAKTNSTNLTNFNISVGVTDTFMVAVEEDDMFSLVFDGRVYKRVSARMLWEKIMRATWDWAEPGVLFIDRINAMNNLWYCEDIVASNPCLHPDSLVETTEGRVRIADMKKAMHVYTMGDNGQLTTALASPSFVTKQNAATIVLNIGSGKSLRCTPDHRVWSITRGWVEAQDIKIGERLGHLYRTKRSEVKLNTDPHGASIPEPRFAAMNDIDSGKVVSIEAGEVTDVYDITVEGTHNLIADFVVVHNCGEQPLPPYGACLLASYNLTKYKQGAITESIYDVVKALDNVIDETTYPLIEQEKEAKAKRRIGIGVTGLANYIESLGYLYGSVEFLQRAETIFQELVHGAYRASIQLARERGPFELFDKDKYLKSLFVKELPEDILEGIAKHGIRNSHLISFAPCGTISITADNVSSGIEPVFSLGYTRTVLVDGLPKEEHVVDYGRRVFGVNGRTADECTITDHLSVLALATKYSDSAVSKTINVGADVGWEEFKNIYMQAWKSGGKGCTTFRASGKRYGVLNTACYIDTVTGAKSCE